jgi:hypothetical protein
MTRNKAIRKAIDIVIYLKAHFAKSQEARKDAEEIIEALEQIKEEQPVNKLTQQAYEDGKKDGYLQAKADQALNTSWIPVSERLPEKNVEVLATTESGYITIAEWFEYDHWFIHEGSSNAHTDELTAWMPLPPSYQGEEGSKE